MIYNILWSDKSFGGAEIYVRKMQKEFAIPFITLKDKSVWQLICFFFTLLNPANQYIFHDTRASLFSAFRFFYRKDICVLHGPGKHPKFIFLLNKLFNSYCYRVILVNSDIFSAQASKAFHIIENESALDIHSDPTLKDVVYFGRLEKSKGVDVLCKYWQKHAHLASLHIVGDGSLLEPLKRQFPNIQFYGALEHQELHKVIENSAFYISCSNREGKSLSLMEAMSTGLIPIVCDIQSQRFLFQDLQLPMINEDLSNFDTVVSTWLNQNEEIKRHKSQQIIKYSKCHLQGNWSNQWHAVLFRNEL
ncbi:glycosyltransferase [Pseudoalteromonas sp.]|uniref:glycosyltransferase n=1 Tax=Pseudoalteromonas sp. TaxID=53249 RepID=UPI003566CB5F